MRYTKVDYDKVFCVPNCIIDAEYDLMGNEQKMFLALLSLIKTDKPLRKSNIKFHVRIIEIFDLLSRYNIYSAVPKLVKALRHAKITISGKAYNIFSNIQYSRGLLDAQFNFNLTKLAFAVPGECTKLKLKEIQQLHFAYAVRLYILLKKYSSQENIYIPIQEFRKKLGITHKYLLLDGLNDQLLKKAQADLANTPMDFDFEFVRTDNKYDTIKFTLLSIINERGEVQ